MMDKFIHIITTGDTTPLTKENWSEIMTDYLTQTKSKQAFRAAHYESQINFINNDIYLTSQLVALMARTMSPQVADALRKRGYKHQFAAHSIDSDLQSILTSLKHKEVRMGQLKHELEQMQSSGSRSPVTAMDFHKERAAMSTGMKTPVAPFSQMTVMEYCALRLTFTEYIDAQNKAYGGRQN